jgi:signal transduction histidine kinase
MREKTIISGSEVNRKHFILRILLISVICLALFAFLSNLYGILFIKHYTGDNPLITGIASLFYLILFYFSRKKDITYVSRIFVFSLFFLNVFVNLQLGIDLPASLLFYCLIIVIAGILLSSENGILLSVASAVTICIISYLQIKGLYHIDEYWKQKQINFQDTIIYTVMLGIISVVSWLSNREIEKSLERARNSEKALQEERDKLEETVEQRTAQLRQVQTEKFAQLYHFIEFGKLAGGLFHDFMTPLNLVSLNLENINEESKTSEKTKIINIKKYLRRAIYGTKRLETFISIARKQLHDSSQLQQFSLTEEIDQVVKLFRYNSQIAKVVIQYKRKEEIDYFGNPLKFNQIITNLLSNAIDSFVQKTNKIKKLITIQLYKKNKKIYLQVSDNGMGMNERDITKIFDPLFTTKEKSQHMGLGLYLIKEIVQKDLNGEIFIKSKITEGTTFTVCIPLIYHEFATGK